MMFSIVISKCKREAFTIAFKIYLKLVKSSNFTQIASTNIWVKCFTNLGRDIGEEITWNENHFKLDSVMVWHAILLHIYVLTWNLINTICPMLSLNTH